MKSNTKTKEVKNEKKNEELINTLEKENIKGEEALSFNEYQRRYAKRRSAKLYKSLAILAITIIGIILFASLLSIASDVYTINNYAGIAVSILLLIIYILFFIVPIVYIAKTRKFITNVNYENINNSIRHNRKVCYELANNIIDLDDCLKKYNKEKIIKLRNARDKKQTKELILCLQDLYKTNIKKESDKISREYAMKCGLYTAISQSKAKDAAIVASLNISMMSEIIYLYGFRPNDSDMAKIMFNILKNVCVAIGLNDISATDTITKFIGKPIAQTIPVINGLLTTLIDSSVEGVINGSLTYKIGVQTRRYLLKEYDLQKKLSCLKDVKVEETDLTFTSKEIASAEADIVHAIKAKEAIAE